MSSALKKSQKIYFICSGTTTNDVINSVNTANIGDKSFLNLLFSKKTELEKDKFSKLTDIGINELYMCQENQKNKNLFIDELAKNNNVYTSFDYSSIESAFVLFNNNHGINIFPLPNMSNETNINNIKEYDIFKKKFGKYNKVEDNKVTVEKTELKNYWKGKNLNNKFLDIKNISCEINWPRSLNSISSLHQYNFEAFKKNLEKNIFKKYDKYNFKGNIEDIDSFIFVCNPKLIVNMLKLFKRVKYNKNIDIIENSSIWELELDLQFTDVHSKIKKEINYVEFTKIYPTEYNYSPLKYNNNIYSYVFNSKQFVLFDSLSKINIKYLKNFNLKNFSVEKRNIIKKKLNDLNVKKNINVHKNKNKNIKDKNDQFLLEEF